MVTEFALQGDRMARDIMQTGADEIARALPHLGWGPGRTICLTGGIGPHYVDYLPGDMQDCVSGPVGEPLDGALSLARDLARDIADERR